MVTPAPFNLSLQVMLRDVGVTAYPTNAQPRNTAHQHMKNIKSPGSMFNAGTTDFEGCVVLAKIIVCIYILCIVSKLQR